MEVCHKMPLRIEGTTLSQIHYGSDPLLRQRPRLPLISVSQQNIGRVGVGGDQQPTPAK